MVKKLFLVVAVLLVGILAFIAYNVQTLESKQIKAVPDRPSLNLDDAANRLSKAIQIQTVSHEDPALFDSASFMAFHTLLKESFPQITKAMDVDTINNFSLLFHWNGTNSDLKPAILLAHMDVVPVDTINESWDFPPFSGLIADGYINGRGALDDKLSLMGMLEAAEMLLEEGFAPERDWYFAFGHDEELYGKQGAMQIAELLKNRGVNADFILDEGLVVTNGMVPGVEKPVALIGISEKGRATVRLKVAIPGGHSSMPEKENSLTVLTKAITAIQSSPFEAQISPPVEYFLSFVGPETNLIQKMAFSNRWLFESMVLSTYQKTGAGSALVQSTIAPTLFHSGIKDNVIPAFAEAAVNLRLLPGLKLDEVIAYFSRVISDDRVILSIDEISSEASPVASIETDGFKKIHQSIAEVFPEAIVSPSLVLATTDSRHYTSISENIYKFLPVSIASEDLSGIHGKNERLSLENYASCISFYYQLMKK